MDSQTYKPISVAHPGESVLNYLDAFGWSQRDLSRRTGLTTKTISEICNGKAPISPATSLALEKVLGRPAHFWMNLQSKFDEIRARQQEAEKSLEWHSWVDQFPVKEMKRRGWIGAENDSVNSDVMGVLQFLGVSSPESWNSVWGASQVAYRQTRKFKTNDYAISAWVRAIEIEADQLEVSDFDARQLESSLEKIRGCTRISIDQGFIDVQSILAKCGVAFVWVPALPETGISGCTRWFGSKKVIAAVSLRYKTEDQIWFTLFHELGHILKHRKEQSFILDNADESLTDGVVDPDMQRIEDEANRFAADTLIQPDLLKKFISFEIFTNESIFDFSEAINISPGIVVGRLQREAILEQHQGNDLKQRVNWSFETEENGETQ